MAQGNFEFAALTFDFIMKTSLKLIMTIEFSSKVENYSCYTVEQLVIQKVLVSYFEKKSIVLPFFSYC